MTTTEQIVKAAEELGKLIAKHPATEKYESTVKKLRDDVEAQRTLNDYYRHLATIAEKENRQEPIEVDDKRKVDELHDKVVSHPVLRNLQMVQMDYLDLIRRVDEAMSANTFQMPGPAGGGPGVSGTSGGAPLTQPMGESSVMP